MHKSVSSDFTINKKEFDRVFETISSSHHHFLQTVCVIDLHGILQAGIELARWVQSLPARNLLPQIDGMSTQW